MTGQTWDLVSAISDSCTEFKHAHSHDWADTRPCVCNQWRLREVKNRTGIATAQNLPQAHLPLINDTGFLSKKNKLAVLYSPEDISVDCTKAQRVHWATTLKLANSSSTLRWSHLWPQQQQVCEGAYTRWQFSHTYITALHMHVAHLHRDPFLPLFRGRRAPVVKGSYRGICYCPFVHEHPQCNEWKPRGINYPTATAERSQNCQTNTATVQEKPIPH